MTASPADLAPEERDPLAGIAAALFMGLGSDGVYARTALYERVFERLVALVDALRDARAEVLRFPPVMSRRQLERSGYLKSFPNLLGCVCVLQGSEAAIRAAAEHVDLLRRRLADGRTELERQNESVEETRRHIEDISRFIAETERHLLEARRAASDGEERR
jgi:hypothetical protein